MRVLDPRARGGQLSKTKVLLSLSAIAPAPNDTVSDGLISPDGSALTLVIDKQRKPTDLSGSFSVIKVSVASGRQLAVLYRPHRIGLHAEPFFFSADPQVQHLLIGYEDNRPTSGWLTGGKVIHLPGEDKNVAYAAW